MKMHLLEEISAPTAPLLVRACALIWQHLLLILCADVLLLLAALPVFAVWLLGLSVPAIWIAALTLGPVWAGISACANRLVDGEELSARALFGETRRHWRAGVAISALPALVATLLLGTLSILAAYPRMSWLYLPLLIDVCLAILVGLACLSAYPLVVARQLRGWRLWKVALAVTMLRPANLLATLALFVGAGLVLFWFNAGLLPLLCAPLAVCLAFRTEQICQEVVAKEA